MKKLILIPILLLSILCNAQFTKGGGMFLKTGSSFMTASAPVTPAEEFYGEYDIIYTAFSTKPHDTIANIQEALVYSLDTAGLWDRIDVLYVFAAHNYSDALLNWKNPGTYNATLTSFDSGDFTQWEGYDGDGTGYISINWNPTADGVNFTINDASVGFYKRDTGTEGVTNYLFGDFGTGEARVGIGTGPTSIQWTLSTYDPSTKSITAANGFFVITRTASNATAAYEDGSLVGTDSYTTNNLSSNDWQIMKAFDNEYVSSSFQISIFFTMDGTNATDNEELFDIFQAFMTALGKQV